MDPALKASLTSIKAGTEEALQTLFVLQQTINNGGLPEMAPWYALLCNDRFSVVTMFHRRVIIQARDTGQVLCSH